MTERRLLGLIAVDSGTIIVGDAVYILPDRSAGKAGADYQEVVDAPMGPAVRLGDRPVLLIQNFGGDGAYAVYGEFDEEGFARLIVDFNPVDGTQ